MKKFNEINEKYIKKNNLVCENSSVILPVCALKAEATEEIKKLRKLILFSKAVSKSTKQDIQIIQNMHLTTTILCSETKINEPSLFLVVPESITT